MEIAIVIGVLIILFFGFQTYYYIKSKKTVGQEIPFNQLSNELKNKIKDKKSIIYFFSPNCHACKQQSPVMEELKSEFKNIFMIDASRNINDARAFNVMGTPSTVFVKENRIADVMIGFRGENVLRKKLANF